MPSPLRPSPNDRPEPQFAGPGVASRRDPVTVRPPGRGEDGGAVASLRLLGAARQGEPPAPPAFTAGERLAVSSALTGGGDDRPRQRLGVLRLSLLLVLLFFAGVGAVTVYHAVAGVLPG